MLRVDFSQPISQKVQSKLDLKRKRLMLSVWIKSSCSLAYNLYYHADTTIIHIFNKEKLRRLQNLYFFQNPNDQVSSNISIFYHGWIDSTLTVNKRFSSAKDELLDCDMPLAWMLHQTNEGTCYCYAFITYIYY